ncbi:hypothetical protein BDN67DRAFT_1072765 [Paxillus ammoniavirescens]|nr:hypothetical protein BDN67DRAFT_1072765 [Paxillus ammoniavirescens]
MVLQTEVAAETARASASDAPEDQLYKDIQALCHTALTIDQIFYDIERKLSKATKEQQQRAQLYEICYDLETRWKQHHETYKKLLWHSRRVAGAAQCAVDEFAAEFLPSLRDPSTTPSERQQLVTDQIEELEVRSSASEDIAQKFEDLSRDLDTYSRDLSQAIEKLDSGGKILVSDRVRILKGRLRSAKIVMDELNAEVKELGWRCAKDVVKTSITGLLGVLAPLLLTDLNCKVKAPNENQQVGLWKRRDCGYFEKNMCSKRLQGYDQVAVKEFNITIEEYKSEKSHEFSEIESLESTFNDTKVAIDDVTTKLGALSNVWAVINADVRLIRNRLDLVKDPGSQASFIKRVKMLETLYARLGKALRHYQVTVRLPQNGAR